MRGRIIKQAVVLAVSLAAVAAAAPVVGASAANLDHFTLDSYYAWHKPYTPPVSSDFKLKEHKPYVATVAGTFSYYSAINYVDPQKPWTMLCGTPEAAPAFESAGGTGEVGFDAEFVFARPWLPKRCNRAKLPVQWTNFQMNNGTGWMHPSVLNLSNPDLPNPNHTYEYAAIGYKKHLKFRLFDLDTRDNYGSLHISIREATASDCAGTKYEAFGYRSFKACQKAVKGKGK